MTPLYSDPKFATSSTFWLSNSSILVLFYIRKYKTFFWWSFQTLLKTSKNSGCELFAVWCSCTKNLFLLASDQPGVQSSPKPSWQASHLKLYARVLPPIEETVFSNFLKGCDDGILHVGLVDFKLCLSSDVQKRTHFGKLICSCTQGNGWQPMLHIWQAFEWLNIAVPVEPIWAVAFSPVHHHQVTDTVPKSQCSFVNATRWL